MPWCPKCKLEYVEGIKICPDCNAELVDSLDDIENAADVEEQISEAAYQEMAQIYGEDMPTEEEREEIMNRIKTAMKTPGYKSKEEEYINNRSGAGVLVVCGIMGIAVLLCNALGVFSLPVSGLSLTLCYIVMGCLFFVFLVSGIRSIIKAKILKPEVAEEKAKIDEILEYIKSQKEAGAYKVTDGEISESDYLVINETVVNDVNEHFEGLEEGFAFYVVDRFAADLLYED